MEMGGFNFNQMHGGQSEQMPDEESGRSGGCGGGGGGGGGCGGAGGAMGSEGFSAEETNAFIQDMNENGIDDSLEKQMNSPETQEFTSAIEGLDEAS